MSKSEVDAVRFIPHCQFRCHFVRSKGETDETLLFCLVLVEKKKKEKERVLTLVMSYSTETLIYECWLLFRRLFSGAIN